MTETIFFQVMASDIANSVTPREYNRLLGLPRDRAIEGDLLERAEGARNWYALHGSPFVTSRRLDLQQVSDSNILVGPGVELRSLVLAQRLRAGQAHALVVMAASAGIEVAEEAARLWSEGRPDESFFLDRFAVAVTERLLFWTAATLCREAEPAHETVLPHLSPGCGNWDLGDQHKLMSLLTGGDQTLGPLQLLPSGALFPQHSVLAAMGVTHLNLGVTPESLCRSCDWNPCAFRRAPYSGEALHLLEIR